MELFRQAANTDGDYVLFRKVSNKAEIHYQVYIYNNRTAHSLLAYHKTIAVGAIGREHIERLAVEEAITTFEEACDFMGIEMEEA